jgi:ribosomal protein L37AE/L43A
MCHPAKRVRDATTLPSVIVKQLVQYIPDNTYLYLYKIDQELVCCQQSLFGVCSQCDAVRRHAAKMWPCLRKICSAGYNGAGRSLSDNAILELNLQMQHDTDYEPMYLGGSVAQAHNARTA